MSTAPDSRIWIEPFVVRAYEAGPDGLLSSISLCNYFQEAAGNHAHALGVSSLLLPGWTWVLSRLHVRIDRMPAWRKAVRIETWPSGHNGLLAWREFSLLDDSGIVLAAGSSAWVMIDLARRRPVRLPPSIDAIPIPDRTRPIADPFPRLDPPSEAPITREFEVYPSDLDQNGHANNVCFAAWALDALPATPGSLSSLEIDFRAEARAGDRIVSAAVDAGDGFLHAIYRQEDGSSRLLAVARSVFDRTQ